MSAFVFNGDDATFLRHISVALVRVLSLAEVPQPESGWSEVLFNLPHLSHRRPVPGSPDEDAAGTYKKSH